MQDLKLEFEIIEKILSELNELELQSWDRVISYVSAYKWQKERSLVMDSLPKSNLVQQISG